MENNSDHRSAAAVNAIDLKQLRYFVGIIEAGSITRAANQLHIAQSALSRRMADLEYALGAQLLNRGPSGIQATEHGHILYVAAKRILNDLETVAIEVQALGKEPVGTVRFGCIESTALLLAYPLKLAVQERLPKVRLVFMSGQGRDLYRRLCTGDLDIALIPHDEEVTGVHIHATVREEFFVTGSARLAGNRSSITLDELSQLPFIMPSSSSFSLRSLIKETFSKVQFQPRVVAEVDALSLVKKLVLEGHGYSFFPWSVVHEEVKRGNLTLKRIHKTSLERDIEICSALNRPVAIATQAVNKIAVEIISQLIATKTWQHVSLTRK